MADYVRKTILSQGYVHIVGIELSKAEKDQFEVTISHYQKPRAERLIGMDITPQVRTQDGSLKVYSTVYGSLSDALGQYTDFLTALKELHASSKMLADACNLESLYASCAPKKSMVRSEARTGIVRAVRELYDRIVYLTEGERRDGHTKIQKQLSDLDSRIVMLNQQLTFSRDKKLVWTQIAPLLNKLSSKIYNAQATPDPDKLAEYKKSIKEMSAQVKKFENEPDIEELEDLVG